MSSKVFLYIGAGILFLIGLCLVGYAALAFIGSTNPTAGQSYWVTQGIWLGIVGLFLLGGGGGLLWLAIRGQKTEIVQQVTMQVDLPGETKIEEMKCKSCGGVLSAKDIKLVNGAPMVNCPYCNTAYQLTEEPKW
jgi:hypothetical protein